MTSKKKLNLFDFDGTLANTENCLFDAYKKACLICGLELKKEYFCGPNFGKKFKDVAKEYFNLSPEDEIFKKIVEYKYAIYPYLFVDKINFFDNILKYLNDYSYNFICTHTDRSVVEFILEKKELKHKVCDIFDNKSGRLKPEPDIFLSPIFYLHSLNILQNIQEINFFEDSDIGIAACHSAIPLIPSVFKGNINIFKCKNNKIEKF